MPSVSAGRLYAINTAGAATGALLAGFVLLPNVGLFFTVLTAAGISVGAAVAALVARTAGGRGDRNPVAPSAPGRKRSTPAQAAPVQTSWISTKQDLWSARIIVALTGFAGLLYEVSWTRAIASLLGPTTYAFAGTVCALIAGLALGGALGSGRLMTRLRARRPHVALVGVLTATALVIWWGNYMLGTQVPARLSHAFAVAPADPGWPLVLRVASIFTLILPAAIGLGCAFTLALRLSGPPQTSTGKSGCSTRLILQPESSPR